MSGLLLKNRDLESTSSCVSAIMSAVDAMGRYCRSHNIPWERGGKKSAVPRGGRIVQRGGKEGWGGRGGGRGEEGRGREEEEGGGGVTSSILEKKGASEAFFRQLSPGPVYRRRVRMRKKQKSTNTNNDNNKAMAPATRQPIPKE